MIIIKNLSIAIVDDEKSVRQLYLEYVNEWVKNNDMNAEVMLFESAEAFLFNYEDKRDYDIILLDYEMKKMNGAELAKKIRYYDKNVQILFISGYSEYIGIGYEVEAINYLIKPIDKNRLFELFEKAFERLQKSDKYVVFKTDDGNRRLMFNNIYYILSDKNYLNIYYNSEIYKVRMTMKEVEEILDKRFHKLDRSTIINIEKIDFLSRTELSLDNGINLTIGRGKFEDINRKFIEYS
ncbi:LytTR family DNA-binding domain-containing protein [Helcococcus ovis]|uniref:LytR/AlgR family response regulator transcription factor n=1 Tax=Helcococcus ovis TaxID=72026 RepID=UPI0038BD982E